MDKVFLKTISTVEAITDMLEEDIYSLRYTMGEKIVEADLVSRYKVSRNTLRESLAYLVSKGLLEKVANKGIYVKEILSSDIDEIFHLRELLEAEAIRKIIIKGSVPPKLHSLADAVSAHNPETESRANRSADIEFHKGIVEAAGSTRLMRMYEDLLFEVKLCMFQAQAFVPGRPINIIHHYNLVRSMEEGDLPQALAYLSEHIDSAIITYQIGITKHLNNRYQTAVSTINQNL